jgi:hypothetical protein
MGPVRAEQETCLRWDEEEQIVHVWSSSPKTWRRMARLGIALIRETTSQGKPSGRFYTVPLSLFRWGLKGKRSAPGNPEALRRAREGRKQAPEPPRGDGEHG